MSYIYAILPLQGNECYLKCVVLDAVLEVFNSQRLKHSALTPTGTISLPKKKKRDADMLTIYLHYFYISLDVQMEEKVDSYLGD